MKRLALLATSLFALACYANPPDPVAVEHTEKVTATVEAIDQAKRLVTLRGESGKTETIEVSPEVRNLAQVKAGDKVVVQYYQGLAAQMTKKGEGTPVGQVDQAAVAGRAPVGEQPGAAVGSVITTTVIIESVNKAANTVTFRGPRGTKTIAVKNPDAQKFIAGLKKDDEVDLTYSEALAISVEPKP
jgi:hypothetical protein